MSSLQPSLSPPPPMPMYSEHFRVVVVPYSNCLLVGDRECTVTTFGVSPPRPDSLDACIDNPRTVTLLLTATGGETTTSKAVLFQVSFLHSSYWDNVTIGITILFLAMLLSTLSQHVTTTFLAILHVYSPPPFKAIMAPCSVALGSSIPYAAL
jgi:hypothetical protein